MLIIALRLPFGKCSILVVVFENCLQAAHARIRLLLLGYGLDQLHELVRAHVDQLAELPAVDALHAVAAAFEENREHLGGDVRPGSQIEHVDNPVPGATRAVEAGAQAFVVHQEREI